MTELPKGWEWATVGEIAEVIAGQSPPGADVNDAADGLPFFQGKAEFSDLYPTTRKWTANPSRLADAGDVLLSVRAPVGPTNLAPVDCAIGRGLMAVRGSALLADRYVLWAIRASAERLREWATGSTFDAVTGPVVRQHALPIAPGAEQARIVAAVEEALSKLDAGDAGLRTVRQLIKRMRDAVLAGAVTGRLVPQDPTDTPATKLLAHLGIEPIEPEGVPVLRDGWVWVALGDIADVVGGVTKDSKRQDDPTFVERPYLRVANVQRGYLDLEVVTTIRVAPEKAAKLELRPGDVLLNEGGDRDKLGRGWVWEGQVEGCIHQNHVFRARLVCGIEPKLVSIWGNTFGRGWFEGRGKQTTNLASINLSTLRSFPIPVAPLEEQRRVLSEVDRQSSFLDACERAVGGGLAHSAALRRSVLKAAFEGKLVPQDPSDEPASMLLARIREERAAAPKAARRSRATA